MAQVIAGTQQAKVKRVAVKKTGHPAAFRKQRCPHCRIGYAVQDNVNKNMYSCSRCGRLYSMSSL